MAFQDFDLISERRRNEKKQKLRKKILIIVVSSVVLVGLIGAAFFVAATKYGFGKDEKNAPTSSTSNKHEHVSHSEKIVTLVCSSADYKDKCEGPLNKAVQDDPKLTHPKDLLKIYVKFAEDEVNKAFNKTNSFKFQSEEEKGAFEDCKQLFQDAKDDLETSISELSKIDFKKLSSKTPDLNSWLSAVISFQQTCVDGFPEGKLKTDLENLFKDSKEFVSNSLAIVSQVTSFLSTFQTFARSRSLLSENSNSLVASLDKIDGLPSWMNPEDRRILKAVDNKPKPNVIVAKDGSGDFKTISEALAAIPKNYQGRYVVYVKEGVYDETVTVAREMQNVTMYGDGSQKSIITGNKNFRDGVRTFQTASFVVLGDGFVGLAMGFRNTAGPEGHQAVAARVQADRAVFSNCRFEGYQDTLYAQTHRQFYRSCIISGTIDFIFGDAASVFQNCIMVVRKPLDNQQNMVTAQGRMDKQQATGIVLQKCTIKADDSLVPVKDKIRSYLGRPWKEYSRTIVMESEIGDLIHPDGWTAWAGDFALNTLYYAEYNNTGPGASTTARVKWQGYKVINKEEATKYTVSSFLKGNWVQSSSVPAVQGLYYN
ncbi:putative pectinesterase/pectinesterase inhibitor 45 [Gastrolobium bilobum]|uniref:putative pectinesterase/pectinesterase inhibitor 45 n=1 Tax=Gastrolobium bilobum TaxID=150636 RepID=UPI002AB1095F|nr:putative pectinesterase/pectinesterase inhibitor 45 [Gastrolobium bilobum]